MELIKSHLTQYHESKAKQERVMEGRERQKVGENAKVSEMFANFWGT